MMATHKKGPTSLSLEAAEEHPVHACNMLFRSLPDLADVIPCAAWSANRSVVNPS